VNRKSKNLTALMMAIAIMLPLPNVIMVQPVSTVDFVWTINACAMMVPKDNFVKVLLAMVMTTATITIIATTVITIAMVIMTVMMTTVVMTMLLMVTMML